MAKMNIRMSNLWETLILVWGIFWTCDCDLHNIPLMSLNFFNSMPYSPNSLFLIYTPYLQRWGKSDLCFPHIQWRRQVCQPTTQGGGTRGNSFSYLHQWCFWAGLKDPQRIWTLIWDLSRKLAQIDSVELELCKMLVYCQGIAILRYACDDIQVVTL